MPEGRDPEVWDAARYEREKRQFVEGRAAARPVALHLAVIFLVTGLAGWACSFLLLRAGWANMPSRYAASFAVAYLAFALAVRVWAGSMRGERRDADLGWWDGLQFADAGEGCLVVVALFFVSLLAAGVVTLLGGVPLLLEVAFEVVFAGVLVRRLGRRERIGDWSARLLRSTWIPALAVAFVLVVAAALLQHAAPGAKTLGDAWRVLHAR